MSVSGLHRSRYTDPVRNPRGILDSTYQILLMPDLQTHQREHIYFGVEIEKYIHNI